MDQGIGKKLKNIREGRGLSIQEVESKLEVVKGFSLKSAEERFPWELIYVEKTLPQLSKIYGVNISDILESLKFKFIWNRILIPKGFGNSGVKVSFDLRWVSFFKRNFSEEKILKFNRFFLKVNGSYWDKGGESE